MYVTYFIQVFTHQAFNVLQNTYCYSDICLTEPFQAIDRAPEFLLTVPIARITPYVNITREISSNHTQDFGLP